MYPCAASIRVDDTPSETFASSMVELNFLAESANSIHALFISSSKTNEIKKVMEK